MPTLHIHRFLQHRNDVKIYGSADVIIEDIQIDSRKVVSGSMYVAIEGTHVDGHKFIDQAINDGAAAILCKKLPIDLQQNVCYIVVEDVRNELGRWLSELYSYTQRTVPLVGVTGTNGKTTIATLLWQYYSHRGVKVGLISTVEVRVGEMVYPSTHTTPDPITLYQLIYQMREQGCQYIFMEVSSHAIDQGRISGLEFEVAVFSNITHDHLDYHVTFEKYIQAKKKFFDGLSKNATAVINIDDPRGLVMVQNSSARVKTYAIKRMGDVKVKVVENTAQGLLLQIDKIEVFFRLVGAFNAYNIAAVYGVLITLNEESRTALQILSNLTGPAGRMQKILHPKTGKCGVVDYAHTPDALENALKTLKAILKPEGRLYVVFGCGGDRDSTKRPLMGNVAGQWADRIVLTSDNPRSEDPDEIIRQIYEGISSEDVNKVLKITDREQAIRTAVMMANTDDIILVAGKGHENYQEIKGEKAPFDDSKILTSLLLL